MNIETGEIRFCEDEKELAKLTEDNNWVKIPEKLNSIATKAYKEGRNGFSEKSLSEFAQKERAKKNKVQARRTKTKLAKISRKKNR